MRRACRRKNNFKSNGSLIFPRTYVRLYTNPTERKLHGRRKQILRLPHQHWRTGAYRRHFDAGPGETGHRGPGPGGEAGGKGGAPALHQGPLPHSGPPPDSGDGELPGLHGGRREGPDVLRRLLPRGGGGEALQIRAVAGKAPLQQKAGKRRGGPGGGAGGGHVRLSLHGPAHPAYRGHPAFLPRLPLLGSESGGGAFEGAHLHGLPDSLLPAEGHLPGLPVPRGGAQDHLLL